MGGVCGTGRRSTNTGASARPGPAPSPRPVPCKASTTRQPRRRGEQARLSYRLDPPPKSPLTGHTHTPPRWGPEEDTGVKGNDTTARPQAPERRPGALQGHHRGSNEARSRTRAGGAAQQRYSPPHRGEGRSRSTRREGEARASAVSEDPRPPLTPPEAGDRRPKVRARGRNPAPAFLPLPDGQGEKSGEGPRGQTEKSRHVPREHLSLVWHGLGPARESTTTPHRSDEPRWSRGKARRGQSPEGPALSLTGNLRPHLASGESGPRPQEVRERLTRGTEPTGRGSHLSLHRVPAAGSAQGRRPTAPRPAALGSPRDRRWHHESGQPDNTTQEPAHRPRRAAPAARAEPATRAGGPKAQSPAYIQRPKVSSAADTEADRVSTYLVVKRPIKGDETTAADSGAHPRLAWRTPGTLARPPVPSATP